MPQTSLSECDVGLCRAQRQLSLGFMPQTFVERWCLAYQQDEALGKLSLGFMPQTSLSADGHPRRGGGLRLLSPGVHAPDFVERGRMQTAGPSGSPLSSGVHAPDFV